MKKFVADVFFDTEVNEVVFYFFIDLHVCFFIMAGTILENSCY